MKRKAEVIREVTDELHAVEAAYSAALAELKKAEERIVRARAELGLNGTFGQAAVARIRDSVAAAEDAQASLIDCHRECYTVYKSLNIRGVAVSPTYEKVTQDDDVRAA